MITKKQARLLIKLIEREARCEIMARFGRFDNLEYADYARMQIDFKDKIRELVLGTSDLIILGNKWGLINQHSKKKRDRTPSNGIKRCKRRRKKS